MMKWFMWTPQCDRWLHKPVKWPLFRIQSLWCSQWFHLFCKLLRTNFLWRFPYAAFTPDAMRCLGAARLHVKSMQRRGQTRIRSDGAHEAMDAARITRLRRLNGAALNVSFQLERQIHVTRSRGSQSAVRISACRHWRYWRSTTQHQPLAVSS